MRIVAAAAAVLALIAAVASIAAFQSDRRDRAFVGEFVRRYNIDVRRPDDAKAIELADTSDLARAYAAEIALRDALAPQDLSGLAPDQRMLWIDAYSRISDELREARVLLEESIDDRPGWAYHRAILGMIMYAQRRAGYRGDPPMLWAETLAPAAARIAGDDWPATFLANAYLEVWDALSAQQRSEARAAIGRALRDPLFVSRTFEAITERLGHEAAFTLLPDLPLPLRAAIQGESDAVHPEGVATLWSRYERAEWADRVSDLQKIEERHRLGDLMGLRRHVNQFAAEHPVGEFDTPAGRRVSARLLELWPNSRGKWGGDSRGDLLTFFLRGRTDDAHPASLYRAAASLPDAPRPVVARAALAAGERYEAQRVLRASEGTSGFEWTDVHLEAVRLELRSRRPAAARAAFDRLSAGAREGCEGVVLRRQIDRAENIQPDAEELRSFPPVVTPGKVLFCLDDTAEPRVAAAGVDVATPAFVHLKWDEGRVASLLLQPGVRQVRIPTGDRRGRRTLQLQTVTGGPVRITEAHVWSGGS